MDPYNPHVVVFRSFFFSGPIRLWVIYHEGSTRVFILELDMDPSANMFLHEDMANYTSMPVSWATLTRGSHALRRDSCVRPLPHGSGGWII